MSETIKKRKIKPFYTEGEALDQEAIIRQRQELEQRIIEDMRTQGYAQVLDITPEMHWAYQKDSENFKFAIIVYGSYVGKKKAKFILGLLGPHTIFIEPHQG